MKLSGRLKSQIADLLSADEWSTEEELAVVLTEELEIPVSYENALHIIREERPFFLRSYGVHEIEWDKYEDVA